MDASVWAARAADLVLILHVVFVLFVVFGLVLTVYGYFARWAWVRNPWFRVWHGLAILVVVGQAWFGIECPLTTLERSLRQTAGLSVYDGPFIMHWLSELLFYTAPAWVFTVAYTLFGILVAFTWIVVRPRPFNSGR